MENKYSIRQIATKANISKSTVARYLKQWDQPLRKEEKRANMGRPKILSARDVRRLRRSIAVLRKCNANFTVKELVRFSGLEYASVICNVLQGDFKGRFQVPQFKKKRSSQ